MAEGDMNSSLLIRNSAVSGVYCTIVKSRIKKGKIESIMKKADDAEKL